MPNVALHRALRNRPASKPLAHGTGLLLGLALGLSFWALVYLLVTE